MATDGAIRRMRDFNKLHAFRLADELVIQVHHLTRSFPANERLAFTHQLRTAALSVPSNIVEGCSRHSERDFLRFLDIAYASCREVQYQLSLARRLELANPALVKPVELKSEETSKELAALIKALRR